MILKLESSIQSDIISYLKSRPKSDTYKHPPYPDGTPDIHHTERGKSFYFEVKRTEEDKPRKTQRLRMKKLRKAGAVCKVVRSVDEVVYILSKHLS